MKTIVIDKNTPLNGNGNAKATTNGNTKNITALTVIETKEEQKKEQKAEPKTLSFAERKQRSNDLSILFEKHEKLKKNSSELLAIVKADESTNTRFILESSNGNEWQTTNQEFIKKTIKVMHEAILEKIEEVETEIELIQIS